MRFGKVRKFYVWYWRITPFNTKTNIMGIETNSAYSYRIITYTVVLDNWMHAEIQLSTLMSSIAADIDHNTIYL